MECSYVRLVSTVFNTYPSLILYLKGNKAATNMRMGLFRDAIVDCNESIEFDLTYMRAYLRRGRAYKAVGDIPNAIKDIKKVSYQYYTHLYDINSL